jgi:hypothetical protein
MSSIVYTADESEFFLQNTNERFEANTVRKNRCSRSWYYEITFREEDYRKSSFRNVVNVSDDCGSYNDFNWVSLLAINFPGVKPNIRYADSTINPSIEHNGCYYTNCCMPIALLYTGRRLSEVDHDQLRAQAFELKQRLVCHPSRMNDNVTDEDLVNYFENYVGFERDVLSIALISCGNERVWVFDWWCRNERPDPATTLYIHYTPSSVQGGAGHYSPYLLP